ncbi:MAG: hypothetical protein ACRDTE_18870 [Pseudonocardiaceae bacterium]
MPSDLLGRSPRCGGDLLHSLRPDPPHCVQLVRRGAQHIINGSVARLFQRPEPGTLARYVPQRSDRLLSQSRTDLICVERSDLLLSTLAQRGRCFEQLSGTMREGADARDARSGSCADVRLGHGECRLVHHRPRRL